MKRVLFILTIVIIICYFQYNYINKTNNSYDILQYENPKKNIVENMLNDKLITIFTNIQFDKLDTENDINNYLYYYNLPLTIETNYKRINENNKYNLIKRQDKYRRMFYILNGTVRFYIFNHSEKKNLYLKNNNSLVNFWNQDTKKFPLISNAKYIEVICRDNTLLSIPYNFYFTYKSDNEVNMIDFYSESIFSKFLKI